MVEDMKGNETSASQEKTQTQETSEQQQSVRLLELLELYFFVRVVL